ncbi:MerR family transcriptional regulator [Rhodococcus erythropolis]|uniref:MerR family transcriptional regulator n=1 Tax=Rhodococcus erythropolis TaxID=1833 RepID=UPI002948F25D|nr:MerR family transcriptional regulator [Rhodococcus erythropolis]MDV6275891.1 MerR family transcriptional regulator [Rhodococcus erythropolis]
MLIGELADRTGVSARALRHYEEQELLVPGRDSNSYRRYDETAVRVVQQIQTMVAAGLGTEMIRRYLDCARTDDYRTTLNMCPDLSAEFDRIAARLDRQQAAVTATQLRLATLRTRLPRH